MKNLLSKELRLFALPMTYCFVAFAFMTMIPGYPILMGAFFPCLGLFQTFQIGNETNDVLYTVLLPIKKKDAVKARFEFVVFIQMCTFAIMVMLTILRMKFFSNSQVYLQNALMNANPLFLAFALFIFSAFNSIFVKGFYKTAYKVGKWFILFSIVATFFIGLAEAIHHIPGYEMLNNSYGEGMSTCYLVLAFAIVVYIISTYLSYRKSAKMFEKVDL